MNYTQAAQRYADARKYPPLGASLGYGWYLRKEEDESYTLHTVWSRYYTEVVDGVELQKRASTSERDKYTMRTLAVITPECTAVDIPPPHWGATALRTGVSRFFEASLYVERSLKVRGLTFCCAGKTPVLTGGRLLVYPTGTPKAGNPHLVRTFDKERQKAFNAQVKKIRRIFALRAKLGAFQFLKGQEWAAVDARMSEKRLSRWAKARMAETFSAELMGVNENDISSIHGLLWLVKNWDRSYYASLSAQPVPEPTTQWEVLFERLLAAMREELRGIHQTVSYVPAW